MRVLPGLSGQASSRGLTGAAPRAGATGARTERRKAGRSLGRAAEETTMEKRRRNVETDPIPPQIRADRRRCRIVSAPSRSGQFPRQLREARPQNEVVERRGWWSTLGTSAPQADNAGSIPVIHSEVKPPVRGSFIGRYRLKVKAS